MDISKLNMSLPEFDDWFSRCLNIIFKEAKDGDVESILLWQRMKGNRFTEPLLSLPKISETLKKEL